MPATVIDRAKIREVALILDGFTSSDFADLCELMSPEAAERLCVVTMDLTCFYEPDFEGEVED